MPEPRGSAHLAVRRQNRGKLSEMPSVTVRHSRFCREPVGSIPPNCRHVVTWYWPVATLSKSASCTNSLTFTLKAALQP